VTCDEVRPLLPAHAIAACDRAEAEAVDAHLRGCSACRAEHARGGRVAEALAYLPDPIAVPDRVRLAVHSATRPPRRTPRLRPVVAGLAAAALVALGVGIARVAAGTGPPADPFARAAAAQNARVGGTVAAALTAGARRTALTGRHGMRAEVLVVRRMHLLVLVAEHLPSGWYRLWLREGGRWHRMDRFVADQGTRCLVLAAVAGRPQALAVTAAAGRPARPMLMGPLTTA